jgi:phosphoglycolate phosphatase
VNKRGLLIFDLDGTLFRADTVTVPAVQHNFRAQGLPVPPADEICDFFGKPVSAFNAWIRAQCPPQSADELVAAIARSELAFVSETGQLYPQVREILTTLRASVAQMAICTNGPQDYVERVITTHALGAFFDAVRYRQSAQDNKPLMVRELLGRLSSRPAIVIGDRHDDVEAAHHNGLYAIAATYGFGAPHELQPADAAATSPADLPALVRSLLAKDQRRTMTRQSPIPNTPITPL